MHNLDPLRATVQVGQTVEDLSGLLQPGKPKIEDSRDRIAPIPAGHSDISTTMNFYVQAFGGDPEDTKFADRTCQLNRERRGDKRR